MLIHIKPEQGKSRDGSLTDSEKSLVKALLLEEYRPQDITYIVNLGRIATINPARIDEVKKSEIEPASEVEVKEYLTMQSSYDPKTLLNPHKESDKRLICARETMMLAVQLFNNPSIIFKTETFCVLANMAWTYILHEKIARDNQELPVRRDGKTYSINEIFHRDFCPISEEPVIANLKEIIKIRNLVEHEIFIGKTDVFYALLQACCMNFERYIIEWFGEHMSLSQELSLAIQFSKMQKEQIVELEKSSLPEKIQSIYHEIETNEFVNNKAFQMTVHYGLKNSSKAKADIAKVVGSDDVDATDNTNREVAIKKQRYDVISASGIIEKIKAAGFKKFGMHRHTEFWQSKWDNAKTRDKKANDYGQLIAGKVWYWYEEEWLPEVLKYCQENGDRFK